MIFRKVPTATIYTFTLLNTNKTNKICIQTRKTTTKLISLFKTKIVTFLIEKLDDATWEDFTTETTENISKTKKVKSPKI